ncbi:serine/threonine-protein kinase [Streptomyces sp. TS71-3]|uniref:serine/threonine-protein kinase n=1 Tax=Streptomyces sp. TS71-3 TaxID=2733862 RepID=UPI001B0BD50D|nr:serine/threonine-protein kinase [Streptomyces sp. TS71-3]GHJ38874.1 hypothetical protein Sm713_44830 [Streptomyces sp. TS71-3]
MSDQERGTGEPRLIADRYQPLRLLGRGSMGSVYEALDTRLDRRVAVKLLTAVEGLGEENESLQRFVREVRALARIDHPGVVTLHDAGVDEGVPYLVMQVLDGMSLAHLVERAGPLEPSVVACVADGAARALAEADRAGVHHRDVKPSNISVTGSGRVVLQDFGLARLVGEAAITRTGALVGTPQFMAPEVMRGGPPSLGADLYSLGGCMYFMLTGELPFGDTRDMGAVVERALGEGVPRLAASGTSDGQSVVIRLVERLCSQDPAGRPEAADLLRDLDGLAEDGQALLAERLGGVLRDDAVDGAGEPRSVPYIARSGPPYGGPLPGPSAEGNPWASLTVRPDGPTQVSSSLGRAGMDVLPSLSNATRYLALSAMTADSALSRQREAVNLVLRGALQEAAEMFSVIVPVCLSALGPDHPTTLTSQYWQGVCLARLGAGAEAVDLFSRVNRQVDELRSNVGD